MRTRMKGLSIAGLSVDVPQDATGIAFGILLTSSGTVWLNHPQFEVVGNDIPTTGPGLHGGPTNLDFEN